METEQIKSAAYLPFSTFITGLDHLAAISIPNKIETSTFTSMNPHNKAQMVSALKFFDLIDKDGTPAPLLSDLAHKKDQRKEIIRALIEKHYPDIVALDFAKMTPSQLETALADKKYNVTGDTKKKAKTFLLKTAQYAGFTIHPLLTKITRNRKKGAEKRAGATKPANSNGDVGTTSTNAPSRISETTASKTPYQVLIEILSPDMDENEQDAVWTLIRYLKKQEANQ